MASDLIVSEVFGPTVQGEGASSGRRCSFVRLGRCNLDCSWCDTPYTWDWHGKNGVAYDPKTELSKQSIEYVVAQVNTIDAPLVVVSGGEPLLQRSALTMLVCELLDRGFDIEIETNGTQRPLDTGHARVGALRYNVSPKLHSSGVDQAKAWVPAAIAELLDAHAVWKFVIGDERDTAEVLTFVRRFEVPDHLVWVMPEGRSAAELDRRIGGVAQLAVNMGWNVSTRLQVYAWGAERGR